MFKNDFVDTQNAGLSYYRTVLSLLRESTDDYIFIWVLETNSLFFDLAIREKYNIGEECL